MPQTLERSGDGDKDMQAGINEVILHANGGRPPEEWGLSALEQRFGTAEDIYGHLGEVALMEPKLPAHGRNVTPTQEYFPHRHSLRVSELRALGGLSTGQRRHLQ